MVSRRAAPPKACEEVANELNETETAVQNDALDCEHKAAWLRFPPRGATEHCTDVPLICIKMAGSAEDQRVELVPMHNQRAASERKVQH